MLSHQRVVTMFPMTSDDAACKHPARFDNGGVKILLVRDLFVVKVAVRPAYSQGNEGRCL